MYRYLVLIFLLNGLFFQTSILAQEQDYESLSSEIESSFHFQTGDVVIKKDFAHCILPSNYQFLDSVQTREMLINFWAESENSAHHLGLISNKSTSVFAPKALVFTVDYIADGHVSDYKQNDINDPSLFDHLKRSIDSSNINRKQAGLEFIQIRNWAMSPIYNAEKHALYWIEEIEIGESREKRLSANACILGRAGYIRLSSIVLYSELKQILNEFPELSNSIQFYKDQEYSAFTSSEKHAHTDLESLILGYSLPDQNCGYPDQQFYLIAFSLMLLMGGLFWLMNRKK
jgi:uncharacterized membrane-anchored protein